MGSDVHVQMLGDRTTDLADVGQQLDELEQCWSRFRSTSELCRLNDDARSSVEVSPMLMLALHRALLGWQLTAGWFDPTVLDALCSAGYRHPYSATGGPRGDLSRCRPTRGMADVSVDVRRNVIERPAGLRFDLGGIGKGLAADLIATRIIERGAVGACVGMGGDVRVAGAPPTGGWRVPVEDPRRASGDRLGSIWFDATLHEGAMVTSTRLFRSWTTDNGEPAHHLIDPMTGRPSDRDVDAVIVAAREAWWAEVLAKAALVAGSVDGRNLLERHQVTGWIVPSAALAEVAT